MAITASALADKFRRAFRNKSGTTFSAEEIRALAEFGALHLLARMEADEILEKWCPKDGQKSLQPSPVDRPVYSIKTLAERWQCSGSHVRKLIADGKLKAFKHGAMYRIRADAVAEVETVGREMEGR